MLIIRQALAMESLTEILQVLSKNNYTKLYAVIKRTVYEPIAE